jgi:hypothetical protein
VIEPAMAALFVLAKETLASLRFSILLVHVLFC